MFRLPQDIQIRYPTAMMQGVVTSGCVERHFVLWSAFIGGPLVIEIWLN
jgi:hypothetical protein